MHLKGLKNIAKYFTGFLTIPKPTKGNQHSHSEEFRDHASINSQTSNQTEEKQVKLKKNVDLFSGIALIVGTMIGKHCYRSRWLEFGLVN